MERTVLKYAPSYWVTSNITPNQQITLDDFTEEFKKILCQLKHSIRTNSLHVDSIKRNQNIYDLGQVLIQEQLLSVAHQHYSYYRVRRYIIIKRHYLSCALEYNLDPRRCGCHLTFRKHISCPAHDEIVLVVQVVTNNPEAESIEPKNSHRY